jgi:SAM-dependent methyltransferase
MNYVSEIYRVLKRDGFFIVTTPNRAYRLKPGQKPLNEFHVREYYRQELENILRKKFSDVSVWGIRGNEEVQRIEKERVKSILVLDPRFDPLNLKRLIPRPVRAKIAKILRGKRYQRGKNDADFLNKYSLEDYYIIKDDVDDSLVLLGVCKK